MKLQHASRKDECEVMRSHQGGNSGWRILALRSRLCRSNRGKILNIKITTQRDLRLRVLERRWLEIHVICVGGGKWIWPRDVPAGYLRCRALACVILHLVSVSSSTIFDRSTETTSQKPPICCALGLMDAERSRVLIL
jgi:hypothetical protein